MNAPLSINLQFIALILGLVFLFYRGLRKGLTHPAIQHPQRIVLGSMGILAGWLLLQAVLAKVGFFTVWEMLPPRVALTLVGSLIGMFVFGRTKLFKLLLEQLPATWPIYAQSFRIPVEIILWQLFVAEVIPIQMTFEGLNFDVFSGILALPVGYLIATQPQRFRKLAIAYNILGLILVTTIVTIAVLSFPTEIRVFTNEPANRIVATWPFIWLPGFAVGMAYFLHYVSLRQLLQRAR